MVFHSRECDRPAPRGSNIQPGYSAGRRLTASSAARFSSQSATSMALPLGSRQPAVPAAGAEQDMRSPKRSMAFARPRSFTGADPGGILRLSSSRRWNGSTGSITAGCWSQSAISRQPRLRNAIAPCWSKPTSRRDLTSKPGAVHPAPSRIAASFNALSPAKRLKSVNSQR